MDSFRADMREADDKALTQARVFVDGYDSALRAGDLAQPIQGGIFDQKQIEADLVELAQKPHTSRRSDEEFTLFKSAGLSLEDLATAELANRQSYTS